MFAGILRSLAPAIKGRRSALRGERGSVMVFTAISIVALFSFCILAIDGPILMTTKTQLQNAADAAALAGAWVYDPEDDSKDQLAKDMAKAIAAANYAVQDSVRPVLITDADITFPEVNDAKRIRVRTFRTQDHGDPLRTYFLRIPFLSNSNLADVEAVAAAEQFEVCGVRCVKPWAIPDRWDDANGNLEWDDGEDYVDANKNGFYDVGESYTDANGNGLRDPGEFYDPIITGYQAPGDIGTNLTIKEHESNSGPAPGQYYPINLPPLGDPDQSPLTGGDWYRQFIGECAPFIVAPGDSCQVEPGKMVGPTIQGVLDLIAQDPTAQWNSSTGTVDSELGFSPRIILVPFFDPRLQPTTGRNYVHITKIGAFFLESVGPGSQVNAKFMRVGSPGEPCDVVSGGFITSVHLVE